MKTYDVTVSFPVDAENEEEAWVLIRTMLDDLGFIEATVEEPIEFKEDE